MGQESSKSYLKKNLPSNSEIRITISILQVRKLSLEVIWLESEVDQTGTQVCLSLMPALSNMILHKSNSNQ